MIKDFFFFMKEITLQDTLVILVTTFLLGPYIYGFKHFLDQ